MKGRRGSVLLVSAKPGEASRFASFKIAKMVLDQMNGPKERVRLVAKLLDLPHDHLDGSAKLNRAVDELWDGIDDPDGPVEGVELLGGETTKEGVHVAVEDRDPSWRLAWFLP